MIAAMIVDSVGVLAHIEPQRVEKCLDRGEIEPTRHINVYRLIERPMRPLTGQEKRNQFLAKSAR